MQTDKALRSWAELNKVVMDLSEKELQRILDIEVKGKARLRMMMRIYHRLSKVRGLRERVELAGKARG